MFQKKTANQKCYGDGKNYHTYHSQCGRNTTLAYEKPKQEYSQRILDAIDSGEL